MRTEVRNDRGLYFSIAIVQCSVFTVNDNDNGNTRLRKYIHSVNANDNSNGNTRIRGNVIETERKYINGNVTE